MSSEDPVMLICGPRKKHGRSQLYGVNLSHKIQAWVTDDQFEDLKTVASMKNKKHSQLIRDAIDSYVEDFRDRPMFKRPNTYMPE